MQWILQQCKGLGKTALHSPFTAPAGRRDASGWWGQDTEQSKARFSPFREMCSSADQTFCSGKGKELTLYLSWARDSWRKYFSNSAGVLPRLFGSHLKPRFPTNLINNEANFLFTPHLSVVSGLSLSGLQNLERKMSVIYWSSKIPHIALINEVS